MKKNNSFLFKKAFTLIEFMIAITIVAILLLVVYTPYNYYSNKAKLKITSKEISQILSEARNKAIHGFDKGNGNLSVGVYFDSTDIYKNEIRLFSFPHDYVLDTTILDTNNPNIEIFKTYKLQEGIEIDLVGAQDNGLFYFEAISGNGSYFYYLPNKTEFSNDIIDIEYSYKDSSNLIGKISYITKTYVSDY